MGDPMFRKLLAALVLFSCAGVAHAGDKPLYAPAPAWVLAAPAIDPAKLTDDDPVFLRLDQQQRFENGQVAIYSDNAFRVASTMLATQLGTIQLPWLPDQGDLTIHKVEILRGGERIDVLAGGTRFNVLQREQNLENAFLSGMLTATLSVEGLRVGDVLHAEFTITRRDNALGGGVQSITPLPADPLRLGFGRLRMMWPDALPLKWRAYGKQPATEQTSKGGWHEMTVAIPYPKQSELPDDAPMRFKPLPLFEASTFADWRAVSATMAAHYRTEGTILPGSPLAAEVDRIRAASQDPRVRAAMALQLVQDKIRYLFRGMDEGNYVPQSPTQTWTVRYGDCKAKTMLLVAILRELGIEAEPALVSATAGDLVPTRLPAPAAFDHVIAHAVIGGKTLWLDGTASGSRLSDLDDVPPFRHALPLRAGGSDLVDMPMRLNSRPDVESAVEIDQRAGIYFPAPFKVTMRVRGATAEMLRMGTAAASKEQADEMIDGLANRQIPKMTSVIYSRSMKYDEASSAMEITAAGIVWNEWQTEDGKTKLMLDSTVDGIDFTPNRLRADWRDIPVSSGSPGDSSLRTTILLPRGGTGFALEGDQTLPEALGAVLLSRKASLTGGAAMFEDRVATGLREVAPEDIAAARRLVTLAKGRRLMLAAPADQPPPWREAVAGKASNAFAPILSAFAGYIADKPKDGDRYVYRASFLESIFDWQGALQDADKAVSIEPSADHYLARARLRSIRGDDKGAIADMRAAVAAEPGSTGAIRTLALELSRTGKLDEGLAMLADQAEGEDRVNTISTQATMLAENGRGDEGIALLDDLIKGKPGNSQLLNSRCWLKGTANLALDTGLKDCSRAIEMAENPQAALDSRALIYFRLERYDEAIADLNAALEKSPGQSASLFLRGVVLKRQGKSGDADLAAARMISPRIDAEYARYGIKP